MRIKVISTIAISLMTAGPNFAQALMITPAYADSIQKVEQKLGSELNAILLYNDAVKSFGYADTIVITRSDAGFNFFYKDSLLTGLLYWYSKNQVKIDYSRTWKETYLFSSTQQSLTDRFELFIRDASFDRNDLVYKLSNFSDDVQTGRYEERTKSGKVLVTGQYSQMDSMYIDTLIHFDPETYEESYEILHRTKVAIKSGIWRYYSPEGLLVKEEKY